MPTAHKSRDRCQLECDVNERLGAQTTAAVKNEPKAIVSNTMHRYALWYLDEQPPL